jgi:hypothetical protein
MKIKIGLLGLFVFLISATNCQSQDKPKDFDFGRVENGKYLNSYFNFEMQLPPNWIIQTKEQMDNMTKKGNDLIAGDDAKMKAILKASEVNVANLLSASQFEKGAAVEYNPGMVMIAENVKAAPGIKLGKDYLFQSRRILEQSQFKYDYLDKEFLKESIGGMDFYKMNAEVIYLGLKIKQIYYSTILDGFSLNIIISFINDQQREELLKSVQSAKLKS